MTPEFSPPAPNFFFFVLSRVRVLPNALPSISDRAVYSRFIRLFLLSPPNSRFLNLGLRQSPSLPLSSTRGSSPTPWTRIKHSCMCFPLWYFPHIFQRAENHQRLSGLRILLRVFCPKVGISFPDSPLSAAVSTFLPITLKLAVTSFCSSSIPSSPVPLS